MEKDAAGYPQGHTNPGTSRTSPAAYPTSSTVLRGRGGSNVSLLPDLVRARFPEPCPNQLLAEIVQFVEHYLGEPPGSAVDAVRRAGYQWREKLRPQLVEISRENGSSGSRQCPQSTWCS